MRHCLILISCCCVFLFQCNDQPDSLFNGKNFQGWEGDTLNTWAIEDGAIAGGSLEERVPHNNFLCTVDNYSDFLLSLKFKLVGEDGFINAGIQFRSRRADDPDYEMIGYQADLGDGYWGSLYDESRRNKILAGPDSVVVARLLIPDGWNTYEIRAEGDRIRLFINGEQTVDYVESDPSIPRSGVIGLQIHGGGKAKVYYKDLLIRRL